MTSHSVGGSSWTGAKFCDNTWRGSMEGLSGGSMKLLMMSSNAFSISAGTHEFVFLFSSTRCCGVVLVVDDDGLGLVIAF